MRMTIAASHCAGRHVHVARHTIASARFSCRTFHPPPITAALYIPVSKTTFALTLIVALVLVPCLLTLYLFLHLPPVAAADATTYGPCLPTCRAPLQTLPLPSNHLSCLSTCHLSQLLTHPLPLLSPLAGAAPAGLTCRCCACRRVADSDSDEGDQITCHAFQPATCHSS